MDTQVTHSGTNISPHLTESNAVKNTHSTIKDDLLSTSESYNQTLKAWNKALTNDPCRNLSYSFDIIYSTLPNYLRPFLPYAQELERHLFINSPKIFNLNDTNCIEAVPADPALNPLTKFVSYAETTRELAFKDLILFGRSSDDFFAVLNNYGKGCLLNVVEHMLHEPNRIYHLQYSFNTSDLMKEQVLMAMLSAKANENRIRKIFRSGVYRYKRLEIQIKQKMIENGNYTTDKIGWQKMTRNNNKCRFASLIISLYCICMRVMLNQNQKRFSSLDLENLPHSISYVIATACYLCVREIYSAMYFRYWSKTFFLEFFPHVEDIFELLELLSRDQVQPVYCVKCGAPFFCDKNKKKRFDINKQDVIYCPNCKSQTYFRLSDICDISD